MSERHVNGSTTVETAGFLPATTAWFARTFPDGPTTAQTLAWTHIARGENVLLVSPTGTGKTLAAFLVALDRLASRKLAGDTAPRVSTVYISPLKALDNDVARNLEGPRTGLTVELAKTGATVTLDAAVRTGDTTQAARASQLKTPPDVLITTPESLALLLVGKGRRILDRVDTLILDEIHSVAGTKRGVH
ncbi:MAG: DEAD/DEAH box helicase, partial [Acidobacteria bacterium]|nr:DEAD/DEAH box helicase [Acidobacteriota bacterium]